MVHAATEGMMGRTKSEKKGPREVCVCKVLADRNSTREGRWGWFDGVGALK